MPKVKLIFIFLSCRTAKHVPTIAAISSSLRLCKLFLRGGFCLKRNVFVLSHVYKQETVKLRFEDSFKTIQTKCPLTLYSSHLKIPDYKLTFKLAHLPGRHSFSASLLWKSDLFMVYIIMQKGIIYIYKHCFERKVFQLIGFCSFPQLTFFHLVLLRKQVKPISSVVSHFLSLTWEDIAVSRRAAGPSPRWNAGNVDAPVVFVLRRVSLLWTGFSE